MTEKDLDEKGNKRYRVVADYRRLNELIIVDNYPIPDITGILDQLREAMYVSNLDLKFAFYQVEIEP